MQSIGFDPKSLQAADALAGLVPGARFGAMPNTPESAPIAETLDRAEKMAGMAQGLADRASSLIAQLLGSAPQEAASGGQAARGQEIVVVRRLNDQLTDTLSALARIDAQLGRLAAALG